MRTLKDRKDSRRTEASDEGSDDPGELTDEELFRRAMEGLDEAQIYRGKFEGGVGAKLPERGVDEGAGAGEPEGEENTEEGRARVRSVQEAAYFERAMGDVEPLRGRGKYHVRSTKKVEQEGGRTMVTPPLPQEGPGLHDVGELNEAQRELLRRAERSGAMPQLYLRGEKEGEAVRSLSEFLDEQRRRGVRFVEVIHGRGIRSELFPVLKPAVLRWLEEQGGEAVRGYAPRRLPSGDYGALIIELVPC
jgi:DNA-nicking Smr family endonuclease